MVVVVFVAGVELLCELWDFRMTNYVVWTLCCAAVSGAVGEHYV